MEVSDLLKMVLSENEVKLLQKSDNVQQEQNIILLLILKQLKDLSQNVYAIKVELTNKL